MRRGILAGLLAALALAGADKKSKTVKPPDLEVVEVVARRSPGIVTLDGRIRNSGEKPLKGVVLLFDFLATGRQVISTKKTLVAEEQFDPGHEASFHVQTADPVRAVRIVIQSEDRDGRHLRVEKGGPIPIE